MSSNLPPGVTDSMIPGNRPEDEAYDRIMEGEIGIAIDALAQSLAYGGDIKQAEKFILPAIKRAINTLEWDRSTDD